MSTLITAMNSRHGINPVRGISLLMLAAALSACAVTPVEHSMPTQSMVAAPAAGTAVVTPAAVIPPEAQQSFDEAVNLLKSGQSGSAAERLQQLAASYPDFAGPVINLGLLELKANRYESAASQFKQALQRDSNSAAASNYLGVSYRNLGKFAEAESAYQRAIAADDNYAPAHLNLGVLYDLYLQKPAQALLEFERYQALQATPDVKVAGWIKELSARLSAEQKARAKAAGAPP